MMQYYIENNIERIANLSKWFGQNNNLNRLDIVQKQSKSSFCNDIWKTEEIASVAQLINDTYKY